MFGKGKDEANNPREVVITWGDNQQRKAMLYASLFQVAGQVTQICLTTGKTPEEVVSIYTKAYELLDEWYRGAPFKEDVKKLLDNLYPDPPGYNPGEKLA